ncbi:MAG TPA: hypothetical protein VGV35_07655, partial [Bryobacteraceae bacterium]|nr:hypothetical protein [Bryobacteraceae bacterium]
VHIDAATEVKWHIESANGDLSIVRISGERSYFFGDTPGWHLSHDDLMTRGGPYVVFVNGSSQTSYFISYAGQIHSKGVTLPYWIIILVTAIAPAFWLREDLSRRRRLRIGLCQSCGYNLTGNTSGVCPECGTAIGKAEPLQSS